MWKAHCCSCIPQGAFLLISEDVALPQEEEGTSCYWLCGRRELWGIFSMPQAQLWELGVQPRFPGPGPWVVSTAAVRGHGLERQYLRRLEGRSNTWNFNTSSSQNCVNFLKEILKKYSVGLPNSIIYKIFLQRVSFYSFFLLYIS